MASEKVYSDDEGRTIVREVSDDGKVMYIMTEESASSTREMSEETYTEWMARRAQYLKDKADNARLTEIFREEAGRIGGIACTWKTLRDVRGSADGRRWEEVIHSYPARVNAYFGNYGTLNTIWEYWKNDRTEKGGEEMYDCSVDFSVPQMLRIAPEGALRDYARTQVLFAQRNGEKGAHPKPRDYGKAFRVWMNTDDAGTVAERRRIYLSTYEHDRLGRVGWFADVNASVKRLQDRGLLEGKDATGIVWNRGCPRNKSECWRAGRIAVLDGSLDRRGISEGELDRAVFIAVALANVPWDSPRPRSLPKADAETVLRIWGSLPEKE